MARRSTDPRLADTATPLPFAADVTPPSSSTPSWRKDVASLPRSTREVLNSLDHMSRRIDDLARELNCLGHFNDDDDRPRAA